MNPIVKLATSIVRSAIKGALVRQGVPEKAAAQLADLPAGGIEVGARLYKRYAALQQVVVLGVAGRNRRRIGADLRRHRFLQSHEPRP